MTVLSKLSKIAYIGSSSQTLYPIPFEYINTDDIKVSIYTSNNEFVEDWTYSVQYVIEGGNVKVLSGYNIDNTKKLLVLRRVDLVQDNKYREGGDFPAKSTETSFDKLTMITQQLQETLDRCVKVEVLDIQSPEELLQTVYDKLDSATEIAGDAISAANQAQTAADNATAAVNSAEQTLVQTQAYVDSAKVEINNTKNTAINTINSTVAQAKSYVNSAIDEATTNISDIVSDAEGSITNIAVTEANKAIANAAQEATYTATANVNSYVDGTVKPSLQTYVDQAQEDANSAATSMEQAALSATAASNYASNASADADNAAESAGLAANSAAAAATSKTNAKTSETNAKIWAEGTDAQVQALGGEKSAKGWAKASTNLDYTNITNCITEIPQDIKLELKDGVLTLKAGSKVYVPNGFESNGTTPKFNAIVIASDYVYNADFGINHSSLLSFDQNGSGVGLITSSWYSGTTAPTSDKHMLWYDTNTNKIKWTTDYGTTWAEWSICLPIARITIGDAYNVITSIDQVFNGFGYIGSTVFALPGVKGLIPNGRNADGSLKNIEWKAASVITFTHGNPFAGIFYFGVFDNLQALATYEKKVTYYNQDKNIVVDTYQEPDVDRYGWSLWGTLTQESTGRITSFTPKTAFHAVDYSDYARKADNDLSNVASNIDYIVESGGDDSKWYKKYKSGWIHQGGAAVVASSVPQAITLLKPMANTSYVICIAGYGSSVSSGTGQLIANVKTTSFSFANNATGDDAGSSRWLVIGKAQ